MRKLLTLLLLTPATSALAAEPTCILRAIPEIVQPGSPATLEWITTDAHAAIREDMVYVDLVGRATVYPATTHVYSLWLEGAGGLGYCDVEVTVLR